MLSFQVPYYYPWNCVRCGLRNPEGNTYCLECRHVPGGQSWSCPLCTLINDINVTQCICSGQRPAHSDDEPAIQSPNNPMISTTPSAATDEEPMVPMELEQPEPVYEVEQLEKETYFPTESTYSESKCLIKGWLRDEASDAYHFPLDVQRIIFFFFNTPSPQCWDAELIGNGYTVSVDQKTVRKIECNEFSSCYGMDSVHSLDTNCIYQWTLTLHGHCDKKNFQYFIGVSSRWNTRDALFERCDHYTTPYAVSVYKYMYSGAEGDVRSNKGGSRNIDYGEYFGDGDTVQVRLQFFGEDTRPSLSFAVNGNDHKVAFKELDVGFGKYYRLAVTVLGSSSVSIERVDITDTA